MAIVTNASRRTLQMLAALVLVAMAALPAMAVQEPSVSLLAFTDRSGAEPGVFDVIADPGDVVTVPLQLRAGGETAIEADIRVANVESAVNGGVLVSPPDAALAAPATWLDVATGHPTLEPGGLIERPVTVRIPATAAPGLYVAAVVAQAVAPAPVPNSDTTRVVSATALIAILVSGEAEAAFTLDSPTLVQQGRGNVVQVGLANTGTLPVSPAGTLSLADSAGAVVAEVPVRMGAVFAGTSTVLEVPLIPLPPAGSYDLTLELEDADTGATASIEDSALVVPAGLEALAATAMPATPEPTQTDALAQAEIRFEHASVRAEGDPLLSVYVEASIANTGSPIASARLVLVAVQNGHVVEEAVLADRMSLATGVTSISTRYAPEDGFGSGIWTFSLRLETVDADGNAITLAQTGTVAKIDLS